MESDRRRMWEERNAARMLERSLTIKNITGKRCTTAADSESINDKPHAQADMDFK